jgi:hypothetical protein
VDGEVMFVGVVNPRSGSSLGLELVKLLGGGFDSGAGRMRFYFDDIEVLGQQVPTDARAWVRTPMGLLVQANGKPVTSRAVDIRVDRLDSNGVVVESVTLPNAFTYERRYQPTFEVVTAALLDVLRSIFDGEVVTDQMADYSRSEVVRSVASLPALLVEGPDLIRDEFRSARPVVNYVAGNQVPRLIPPWARVFRYDLIVTDFDRRRAHQAVGQLVRWLDSGPSITIFDRKVEVVESLSSQFRTVKVAGQDYPQDRVVAFTGSIDLLGVEGSRGRIHGFDRFARRRSTR